MSIFSSQRSRDPASIVAGFRDLESERISSGDLK